MKKQSYTEAIEELESIVSQMENDTISVDVLTEKVKRAAILIKQCKAVLKDTGEEVNQVLKELNEPD